MYVADTLMQQFQLLERIKSHGISALIAVPANESAHHQPYRALTPSKPLMPNT
jgi:hypothetical protein